LEDVVQAVRLDRHRPGRRALGTLSDQGGNTQDSKPPRDVPPHPTTSALPHRSSFHSDKTTAGGPRSDRPGRAGLATRQPSSITSQGFVIPDLRGPDTEARHAEPVPPTVRFHPH